MSVTKAAVITAKGQVEIREMPLPDPGPGEVQVQMAANGICMFEVSVYTGVEPIYPCNAGHEGIGRVVKVGPGVKNLREGDWVPAGRWTQLENLPADGRPAFSSAPKDPALWLWEPVDCVVRALYEYDISPGDRVLLIGSGFMGLLNVQGLGRYPLAELVVADLDAAKLELAARFGATETIRAGTEEGNARLEELKGKKFDLVIEASGSEQALRMCGDLVRNGGRLALFGWQHGMRSVNMTRWHIGGLKVLNTAPAIATDRNINTMERAVRLIERGVFDLAPLVTHRHSWKDVASALDEAARRPAGYIKGVLEFD